MVKHLHVVFYVRQIIVWKQRNRYWLLMVTSYRYGQVLVVDGYCLCYGKVLVFDGYCYGYCKALVFDGYCLWMVRY